MIFDRRTAFKPFEYPELEQYKLAIQHSYWLTTEFTFEGDKHDFHTRLTGPQREAIKRALLAISQIEVSVKLFWAKIGERMPKPEIIQVGMTFAESEVRHSDAYSNLLKVMGLNDDFAELENVPAIQGRVDYLTKSLANSARETGPGYAAMLSLFSLFVENVSLFSQFAVIKSFNKHLSVLKDIDNVVQATQKEEQIHAMFGAALVNIIRREYPHWFDESFNRRINHMAEQAVKAEWGIIDWMFEHGELDFLPKDTLKAFVANRLNQSLGMIGVAPLVAVNEEALEGLRWFDEEIYATTSTDFFHKKPTDYTKNDKAFKPEDLF